MGAFGKFERSVENAVVSVFNKAFKSDVKPVEIASALHRAMDDSAQVFSRERTITPNVFVVKLSSDDYERVQQWGEATHVEELTDNLTRYATTQDYTFLGPISIIFERDQLQGAGIVKVEASTRRGAVAPVTTSAASPTNPIIDIEGQRYLLTGPVTVIGRGSEADVIVDDTGVSRQHLELRITPRGVIAEDLGSTNGTYVEGHRVQAATLVDGNTLTIGRTRIMFWSSPEGS